jgi:hypothetical protein
MTADDRRPLPPLPPPLHPDLDTLADLHADALDPATAERVRAHVAGCAQCAGVLTALDTVGAGLRALPTPRVPAAVADRLDATLADLRRDDRAGHGSAAGGPATGSTAGGPATGSTAGGPAAGGSTAADARPTARDSGPPRSAGPARPARSLGSVPGAEPVRDPGPTRPPADLTAARARKRRRTGQAFGSIAAAVAVLAAGASVTAIVRSAGGSDDSATGGGGLAQEQAPAASDAANPTTLAIPSYDRSTLQADLPEIVQRSAVGIITGREGTGPAGVMSDEDRRTACANTIRGASGELRAVQRIRYQGSPAYVFVFGQGGQVTAYVVSDDCGTSPALPASVLDTVS